MPHVVIDVDSDVPAEQVFAAATDFSAQRPELWPNISREFWQLHDSGPNWADATEGSPSIWAREHYEWSGPDSRHNAGLERLEARRHLDPDRRPTQRQRQPHPHRSRATLQGQGLDLLYAVALFGRRMFERNLQKTLDVLTRRGSSSPT
jgi:hypothetical protein